MTIIRAVGYIGSAILIFFAIIYALASTYVISRILVSIIFFMVGFGILILLRRHQPSQVVHRIEVPGRIKAQEVRCPNCSALLDISQVQIIEGTPVVKCVYCGNILKLEEEPKW